MNIRADDSFNYLPRFTRLTVLRSERLKHIEKDVFWLGQLNADR